MAERIIDLHSHTTHSDGSVSAEELIKMAAMNGAAAIAITDHDTVSGIDEARRAARQVGIEFLAGLEISAEYSPGTMHILGYLIDDNSQTLCASLEELKEARQRRNPSIAEKLRSLGCEIHYQEVAALAGNQMVGRPHFARLLVDRGYAESIQEAFNKFLAKGAPAYVEKARLSPADAISVIHQAGGVAVLAHPYQLGLLSTEQIENLVEGLTELGLDGLEAIYSRHTPDQRSFYSQMAARHGLIVTGGSDFHGSYKPDIAIVTGKGDLRVPYELLDKLKDRARGRAGEQSGTERRA
jgi:3',5'-nucleoside bisphosphate phosphatase